MSVGDLYGASASREAVLNLKPIANGSVLEWPQDSDGTFGVATTRTAPATLLRSSSKCFAPQRGQAVAILPDMNTGPLIAEIAALVGEPARASMLSALLDGRALTASELAYAARVTPQTASTHLAKLTEAGLVAPMREVGIAISTSRRPASPRCLRGSWLSLSKTGRDTVPSPVKDASLARPESATTTSPVVSAWTSPML